MYLSEINTEKFFLESLRFCQKNKGLEIYAWCIMSSHVRSIAGQKPELLIVILKDLQARHCSGH